MSEFEDSVTMIEISIKRLMTAEGRLAVAIRLPSHYNGVEVLGLLETAKVHVIGEMLRD